jgi:hypothetical protein
MMYGKKSSTKMMSKAGKKDDPIKGKKLAPTPVKGKSTKPSIKPEKVTEIAKKSQADIRKRQKAAYEKKQGEKGMKLAKQSAAVGAAVMVGAREYVRKKPYYNK